jgi:hypothetical protein
MSLEATVPMSKQNGATAPANPQPQLTLPQAFRELREHGAITTLKSSGRVIHWRPVQLTRMLKAGKIPDHLTAFVSQVVWSDDGEDNRSAKEKAIEWQDYLDLVAASALIHPVISDDPQSANEIAPEALLYEGLVEIDQLARNPLQTVRPFRGEQTADVGVGAESGEGVEAAQ